MAVAKLGQDKYSKMDKPAPKTVLFIDDDPVLIMAYRTRLAQAGFTVQTADDGLQAMRQLALSIPDAIILDLVMPKFNGVEIMGFIRSNPKLKNTPVIVLSGRSIIDAEGEPILETAYRRLIKDTCTPDMIVAALQEIVVQKA
jgi:two-component system phosphate regulon response regulator PhoB